MKRGLLCALIVCLGGVAQVQGVGFPMAGISYESLPASALSDPDEPGMEDMEIEMNSLRVEGGYGIADEEKGIFINLFSYELLSLSYEEEPQVGGNLPAELHALQYTFQWIRQTSERRSWVVFLSPGLISDLKKSLVRRDFGFQAGFIYNFHRENRVIGIGGAWSEDFGQSLPLPFVQFDWTDGGQSWAVHAMLPAELSVSRRMGAKADLALRMQPIPPQSVRSASGLDALFDRHAGACGGGPLHPLPAPERDGGHHLLPPFPEL